MRQTKIEWTEVTWNPTTGCTKVSSGCKNCYAEKMALRLKSMGVKKYENGFELSIHPAVLIEPYKWSSSKVVFVNSMSDLFHEDLPFEFLEKVFNVMNENPKHIFQVLTKRAELLLEYSSKLHWTDNIWMGVTVESSKYMDRINVLRQVPASIKFLSLEPLLSSLPNLNLDKIDWVIVGGESGINSRPVKKEWVNSILSQCQIQNVPFFFKQWGGMNKKKNGRMLDGEFYNEMPKKYEQILHRI
jgi:protein gp37